MASRFDSKIPKPYPDFPLFASGNGCWLKKINGKKRSFGPVRWPDPDEYDRSWREALTAYHKYLETERRGLAVAADSRQCTIVMLVNGYLTLKHAQAESGELKPRTFADLRGTLREYRDALGADTTVGELEADPRPVERHLAELQEAYGFHAYNRRMQHIRSMWNWGHQPKDGSDGLLEKPFKFVGMHQKKRMREFRKQRRLERAAGNSMTFDADEVAALLAHAKNGWKARPVMGAITLLGYYAGYGNTDIAEFAEAYLKVYQREETLFVRGRVETIPAGWALIDFPRPKTEIDRCAIVPPAVVEAIRAVAALKRPSTKATRHLLFRTANGMPLVYDTVHRDSAGLIQRITPTDSVAQTFARLQAGIGWCEKDGWVSRKPFVRKAKGEAEPKSLCSTCGAELVPMKPRGFYCLRHTATTFAAGSGASSDARNLFEGHGSGGVRQAFYLDPSKLHDLLLIARDLEKRLTESGDRQRRASSAGQASPGPMPRAG